MQAIGYELSTCDSVMDAVHGCFSRIREVYVPELGAAFNTAVNRSDGVNVLLLTPEAATQRYRNERGHFSDREKPAAEVVRHTLTGDQAAALRVIADAKRSLVTHAESVHKLLKPWTEVPTEVNEAGDDAETNENESPRVPHCVIC